MGRGFAAHGVQGFLPQSGKVPFNKADGGVETDLLIVLHPREFQSPSN